MAGAASCPARPVAGSARTAAASAVVVPVRPRSRPTGAGSTPGSPSCAASSHAMKGTRDTKRQERKRHEIPSVAIAGYTNAGKSSLLNRLTGAGVLVEDSLFATLDPTTRRTETDDGRVYTMTDTVGFVRAPAAPARRGVPLDAGGGRRRRPGPARRRRLAPRPRGPDRRRAGGLRRDRRRQGARADRDQQGRRRRPDGDRPAAPARAALGGGLAPRPARASTTCSRLVEDELPRPGVEFDGAGALRPRRPASTGCTARARSTRWSTPATARWSAAAPTRPWPASWRRTRPVSGV